MFHKELDGGGEAGMNVGCLIRGVKREDVGAAVWQAGLHQPAHQVQGPGVTSEQGGGRTSHPSSPGTGPSLHPDHGRDREHRSAEGTEW